MDESRMRDLALCEVSLTPEPTVTQALHELASLLDRLPPAMVLALHSVVRAWALPQDDGGPPSP
jgi:hypothetical protein